MSWHKILARSIYSTLRQCPYHERVPDAYARQASKSQPGLIVFGNMLQSHDTTEYMFKNHLNAVRFSRKPQVLLIIMWYGALAAACTCPDKALYSGYQGVFCDKTDKRQPEPGLGIKMRETSAEWYQSRQKVGINSERTAHIDILKNAHATDHNPRERATGVGRMQKRNRGMRGDACASSNPKPAPESGGRSKARLWGYVSWFAVRSNKGVAVSLIFRHSVMAVVEKRRVFPPDLTQWKRLVVCF
jgi:hypothetical protein